MCEEHVSAGTTYYGHVVAADLHSWLAVGVNHDSQTKSVVSGSNT